MRFATAAATACAKDLSGVRAVEEAVKSVIGPVYDKFHLVPDELLRIADRSAPHRPLSPARTTACCIAEAAQELYVRYQARAEQCAAAARQRLLPREPKAVCWTENCGKKVVAAVEKGCRVSSAFVSRKRVEKMFSEKRA